MRIIKFKAENYLPGITLDRENGKFEITGKTCPENALSFYQPILDWLDEYADNPLEETVFDFRLTYYNTVSSKIIMMILVRLEEILEEGNDVKVRWFYPEGDEDIQESGEEYAELVNIEFEMIPYDEEEDDPFGGLIDSLF